ncbi:hypothetical protein MMYC01_203313 [Madurella mycetomatis]|uniref:Uncharacterized protein n=1 Tax=Madurella mycetomatis TaxID=100816 RepID=A0A175W8D8_9PEZI|nr:hypothetical protein MMYC01_203313 [Madurella mycetomatis]
MAFNKPPIQPQAANNDLQEEERLEDDLYRLNQMHLQATQAAFSAYMQSVENASKEVTSFRDLVHGPETEALFARAGRSQKENPKGIKQWRARDDPDWANEERKKRPKPS